VVEGSGECFGCHVGRGADQDTGGGDVVPFVAALGDAEVDDRCLAVDVPVRQVRVVGGFEGVGDAGCDGQGLGQGQSPGFQGGAERFAGQELHHQIGAGLPVVCRGAEVVDGDDVRVGEAACDCGLAGEPGHLPAAARIPGEHLDRHEAVDLGIVCSPDLPEPARTDRLDQPVAPVQHGPFPHDSPFSVRTATHGVSGVYPSRYAGGTCCGRGCDLPSGAVVCR
jgi:hypothetical protein